MTVKGKEESRVYTNIPLIQNENRARRAENFVSNKRVIRFLNNRDTVNRRPKPISENVTVSERLGGLVTYADKKKGTKII